MYACIHLCMYMLYIGLIVIIIYYIYRREASIGLIVTYVIHVQGGRTILYISCWKGHVAVVQLLLQKHADVSICRKVR